MSLKRIDDLFGGRRADTVSALVAALVVALVVGVVIPLWIDSAWVRFVATVAVLAFVTGVYSQLKRRRHQTDAVQ